ISMPQFNADAYAKSMNQLMDEIHARLPDGTWITGVEVFRRLYAAIGFGWLVFPTRLPGLSQFLDMTYRMFAKKRLKLTGRCQKNARGEIICQTKVGRS
ncbi:MAG: DUF393 domain-containing protein, partial [Planctomycetaceae bacterium]|nr:DUF393 domain-containing protein [Planctomycetaceae bacterium]